MLGRDLQGRLLLSLFSLCGRRKKESLLMLGGILQVCIYFYDCAPITSRHAYFSLSLLKAYIINVCSFLNIVLGG